MQFVPLICENIQLAFYDSKKKRGKRGNGMRVKSGKKNKNIKEGEGNIFIVTIFNICAISIV